MPKEFARSERVSQLILRSLATILMQEVKDERVRDLSVTEVEVTKNLRQAKVFVTCVEDEEEKIHQSLAALERASGFIRRQLAAKIDMRHCPNLIFKYDNTASNAAKMDALIAKTLNRGCS